MTLNTDGVLPVVVNNYRRYLWTDKMAAAFGSVVLGWRPNLGRRALLDNLPLVVLCLIPILLYLPVMVSPLERDEGVYATIAQRLLRGDVPYRDLFDNKPPIVYGWYAFSFLVFGEGVAAPRIVAALLLSFTTLAIFGEARMLFPRRVAYLGAGAFAVATGLPFVALNANTEAYMLLPLVASLVAFTIGTRRGRLSWFVLAGALGALAVMTKQVAVWNLVALAVIALFWRWGKVETAWRRITPLLSLLAGAAAATALIATPFFFAGAFSDFVYANISYNWVYVRFVTIGEGLPHLGLGVTLLSALAAPLVVGTALGIFTVLRRTRRNAAYLLVVWAAASAVGVASGGRFFPHYFLQLVPAMVLLTAVVVDDRFHGHDPHPRWKVATTFSAILIFVSLGANALLYLAPLRTEHRLAPTVIYQEEWDAASQSLGAYISARTGPEDTIFNLGRQSQIYFYADRRPAVRYFYDYAYDYDETALPVTLEALRQTKPVYIIDSLQPPLFEPTEKKPDELAALLSQDYVYEGRIFFSDVYRLKAGR